MFKVALSRNDIVIVWRPHPLLYATIKALRPEYADKYKALVDYYINNNVGVYDKTADISRAVAVSDAYIGSYYSSVIQIPKRMPARGECSLFFMFSMYLK